MKKFIILFLIVCITALSSCSSQTTDEKQTIKEETTLSDYEEGYEKGHDIAFGLAYDYGVLVYSNECSENDKPTVPDISSFNKSSEYLRGYQNGYTKGLDEGFLWGLEEAEYNSLGEIEDSALNAVIAEHPFIADVIEHAEETGFEEGWCEGHNEGYEEGYADGYDDGYEYAKKDD